MQKSLAAIEADLAEARDRIVRLEAAKAALTSLSPTNHQPRPGAQMPDKTIYAGISPDTKRPLYVMPQDLSEKLDWIAAMKAAKSQTFAGRSDWRLPTESELYLLHEHHRAIKGFDPDWYWSSSEGINYFAWYQNFGTGVRYYGNKSGRYKIRCVRSG